MIKFILMIELLNHQGSNRQDEPADKSQQDRFSTIFNKLYNICVEPDGSHGHDDNEFADLRQRGSKM